MYYHFADNLHFYERHFELATEIQGQDVDITKEHTFMLKQPFLEYDGKNVTLSDSAQDFINEIDESIDNDAIKTKQDYKDILDKYFVTNGE